MPDSTKSVVISGYYGFDNLGDEAILEELCRELREINQSIKICVLSQSPEDTRQKFGVESISRWDIKAINNALSSSDLFISGGGGLFQDTSSIKSVAYYAFLFFLARLKRVPIFVYAQGIGPLKSRISRFLTQTSMSFAACICVRDEKSVKTLTNWNLSCHLTADPVWALASSKPILDTNNGASDALKIGLSLRQSDVLNDDWLKSISEELQNMLPANSIIVPLILQKSLDEPVLNNVFNQLNGNRIKIEPNNLSPKDLPSHWMSEISHLDMVIAMRLHAAIMALKSGVPVLALAYDPKVATIASDFEQPYIDMSSPSSHKLFGPMLNEFLQITKDLRQKSMKIAGDKEKQARQNKDLLAKFLT